MKHFKFLAALVVMFMAQSASAACGCHMVGFVLVCPPCPDLGCGPGVIPCPPPSSPEVLNEVTNQVVQSQISAEMPSDTASAAQGEVGNSYTYLKSAVSPQSFGVTTTVLPSNIDLSIKVQ